MTILDTIAEYARERTARDKASISPGEMRDRALSLGRGNGSAFSSALAKPGLRFICEIKKASPSKGLIDPVFDYRKTASEYESAGADAVSVLTEPKWFQGSDEIFRNVRSLIQTPMLRKDFVVDAYQIYQARSMGADCILLICSLLDTETIRTYLGICEELGLAALVETHDEEEIRSAVKAGAGIIGVNNRNLRDFSVDLGNASRLRDLIPQDVLYVAESGVRTADDVRNLYQAGADAILVGEALMRAPDKGQLLHEYREAARSLK